MTKFNMIKLATQTVVETRLVTENIRSNLAILAESQKQTAQVLAENVTHVLANIANAATQGEPIKLLHLDSLASFLSGVQLLAANLTTDPDAEKRSKTLRALAAAGIDPDGHVTYAVTPIAQYGARNEATLAKYKKMVQDYAQSQSRGQPDGQQLAATAKQLQTSIDRAMRIAANKKAGPEASGETSFSANKAAAQPAVM